ncbi:hypothetical protein BN1723_006227 [Verticillium longisporum]|uniref:AAA+ ATPase domain-containing protein n=1 Tax=Verticillium longisporum TaxID=100787 RepID=A0A0G4NE19_VERLO|nr:mitochondrial chaperone BCS1-B like protein [Verticillium longisporum]CRK44634.1 hypothetical protein BN1723_006227 [Verticillium longisporum]
MFNLTVLSVWIGNATAVALQPPTNITFYQSLPDANRYILSIANAISLGLWAAYTTASSALRSVPFFRVSYSAFPLVSWRLFSLLRPSGDGISWHERKPRPVQSLDSLFIDDKDELVADCLRFFEPSSQARRTGRGKLPYMGMLLYGRPGTGKSSFALAVAQHLGVPIYRPGSLSTYDDQTFRSLMSAIQQKCVILLEDIDTADVTRSRNEANTSGAKVDKACLGTILEELDSLNVEGGAMVMMTTNHMEKLDPALIRAGRVHRRVEFQLASRETAAALFRNEFKDEMAEHDLDQAAKKFAAQIPDRRFSPAQIDEFLHGKEKDLEGALEGVSGWVKSTEAADLQDSVVGSPSESDGP